MPSEFRKPASTSLFLGIFFVCLLGVLGFWPQLRFFFEKDVNLKANRAIHLNEPKPVPQFSVDIRGGKTFESNRIATITVIHFWATWCEPCVEEFPELIRFSRKYEDKNIAVLAIALDEGWNDVDQFFENDIKDATQKGLPKNFIVGLDTKRKVSELFGSYQYPETYLINDKHEIIAKWVGSQNWSGGFFEDFLDRVLKF